VPDYDVGAVTLTVPPANAALTTYRPAFSVRNYGLFDALGTGHIQIYKAGRLVFKSDAYTPIIPPGQTKQAQADTYFTPETTGPYFAIAFITTWRDQVPANNTLAPSPFTVGTLPPPPPPAVTNHASQHEEGGADELSCDGLHGRTADAQTALAHRATHQVAGADQLDVTGLPGILAQGQPIADHHTEHEDGGGDELNVDELSGVLKNLQKPKVHANEAHDPNYATDAAFKAHRDGVNPHEEATNLEFIAHKNKSEGYCGLDSGTKVPADRLGGSPANTGLYLQADQSWSAPPVLDRTRLVKTEYFPLVNYTRNTTNTVLETTIPIGVLDTKTTIMLAARFQFQSAGIFSPTFKLAVKESSAAYQELISAQVSMLPPPVLGWMLIDLECLVPGYESAGQLNLIPAYRLLSFATGGPITADMPGYLPSVSLDTTKAITFRLQIIIPDEVDALANMIYAKLDIQRQPQPLP